jgi:hypothetical protein
MTRWVQAFEKSAFKKSWTSLLELSTTLTVDDATVRTTVEEIARLKKALEFIDGIVKTIDLDLTPRSVWDNCVGQTVPCEENLRQYSASRNVGYLQQANDHLDNVLTYVRPYMVYPSEALLASGNAAKGYSEVLSEYLDAFDRDAAQKKRALLDAVDYSNKQKKKLDAQEARIEEFHHYLFGADESSGGAEKLLKQRIEAIEANHEAIQTLHDTLLSGPEATAASIKDAEKRILETKKVLDTLRASAESHHEELEAFYVRIFGKTNSEADELREGGLEQELTARMGQLDAFEASQRTRHQTMFDKVEALLPSASSAGLASAYKALKDRFEKPIQYYTRAFYGSLTVLFVGGLAVVSDTASFWPPSVTFVSASNWEAMLQTLLTRIPIIVPIVWVAIFSATRRSQYERLQQEYAHKEALASSYESYKKQLQDLGAGTEELQKALIAKAIDAIAYNASTTLDGKHTEKPPALQVFEKFNADEIKKLLDLLRGK